MRNILIVEDHEKSGKTAVRVCQEMGWNVCWAKNGLEALDFILSVPFEAMVLDMNLPAFREETTEMTSVIPAPRRYSLEGSHVLRILRLMPDRLPKVVIAFSGIPLNNAVLLEWGATHRVDGKQPDALTRILRESFTEGT